MKFTCALILSFSCSLMCMEDKLSQFKAYFQDNSQESHNFILKNKIWALENHTALTELITNRIMQDNKHLSNNLSNKATTSKKALGYLGITLGSSSVAFRCYDPETIAQDSMTGELAQYGTISLFMGSCIATAWGLSQFVGALFHFRRFGDDGEINKRLGNDTALLETLRNLQAPQE